MAFQDTQKELNTSRKERSTLEQELLAAKERLGKLGRRKSEAQRSSPQAVDALEAQESEVREQIKQLGENLEKAQKLEVGNFGAFLDFTDPREHLSKLSDQTPILLFPLRIETRFKKVDFGERVQDQLWVRVYPDDIAVDSFEPLISESEARNAGAYYAALWAAFGDEAKERAAWRALVTSHGSGRAWWITQNFTPINVDDKPAKPDEPNVTLIIAHEALPSDPERDAISAYWQSILTGEANAWDTLVSTVGKERAEDIIKNLKPVNLPETVAANAVITVVFLHLPDSVELETKLQGWTQAPKTHVLPERFVLTAFNNGQTEPVFEELGNPIPASLAVGPDPSLDEDKQIKIEDSNIVVNEDMRWMVDFDEAVAKGMGFRVNLTPAQARQGFDKLYVLGVKMATDAQEGKAALETLIDHHHHSRKGFSILRQGMPTNNTDDDGASYSWQEDADDSFNQYFGTSTLDDPQDATMKRDGRWLAEMLGISPDTLKPIANYHHTDHREALAMNTALWPATLGYFMETMMEPVFEDDTIQRTRDFFTRYVTGRGALPAIRTGKQPYGILPATPFRRMRWMQKIDRLTKGNSGYFVQLESLLSKMSADWGDMATDVSHVGKADGDPHQMLLDIVGLHPSSVEHYSRNAQSFEQLYNMFAMYGFAGALLALILAGGYTSSGMQLLQKFGYAPDNPEDATPDILRKFFFDRGDLLKGAKIDDVPLSEVEAIRDYTDDGRNYIEWLIDAAATSHNALRRQQGFTDNKRPSALLYLMLQHALDLGYVDTSLRLQVSKAVITQNEMMREKREPKFLHIQEENDASSRWKSLYQPDSRITGSQSMLVGDFIPTILANSAEARAMREQLAGLEVLKNVPTARLERAFSEHLDLCTYRLDAWIQGLVNMQLTRMRGLHLDEPDENQGIYLGAYGWLEEVRPENKVLTPVDLSADLEQIFMDQDHPLMEDNKNGGYIHAPSTNHAVTAAVLRNGYIENASAENPDSFAVNLSSERVRLALGIIEGMQGGQSLGALLGYQLERGLHDNNTLEMDGIIFDLRLAFPLRGNRLKSTRVSGLDSIDKVEAKNVVDGLSLIEQIKKTGNANYPFGHSELPTLSSAQRAAVNAEVDRIMNINDAVADLAIAESVHQVVQGNYDRAASTLDTYSKGNFPQIPDVIKTPRSGVTLTHRVGIQLESGIAPVDPTNTTPRSRAEPALNRWLGKILPPLGNMACEVVFTTPTGVTKTEIVTLAMLGFTPIDALYSVSFESSQAMTSLDDAITAHVMKTFNVALNSDIIIAYTKPVVGKISLHEAAPLLRSIKALVQRSRPLNAGDVSLANETESEAVKQNAVLDRNRIALNRTTINSGKNQLNIYATALSPLVTAADPAPLKTKIDDLIADLGVALQKLSLFGLPQTGTGFMWQWQQTQFRLLSDKLQSTLQRLQDKLDGFDATIAEYTALPPAATDDEKFTLLQTAERFISTVKTDISATTPANFQTNLVNVKKPAFEQQMNDMLDILTKTKMADVYSALDAALTTLPGFESVAFDVKDMNQALLVFAEDLLVRAQNLSADIQKRVTAVDAELTAHDKATTAAEKVTALLNAGKHLFGEDFRIIPEFALSAYQGAEWQNAFNSQAQLLKYQTDTMGEDFPIDNWLYGVARVREKMGQVEKATLMAETLASGSLALSPVQLPYRDKDSWLALDYPELKEDGTPYAIDESKLLYTAHYAVPFDATKPQCGLLVDEWTEVIPGKDETTGLTFHYDRPNCEPPQTLLLVTPADFTGEWQWADLVDTLHDTLDLAKKRAVEPDHVDKTPYARFLPALVSAFTVYPITAALNLALNNKFHLLKEPADE